MSVIYILYHELVLKHSITYHPKQAKTQSASGVLVESSVEKK